MGSIIVVPRQSVATTTNMWVAKTVGIIGATGKTGMWAMKGALLRGYTVRVLARNPAKVKTILGTLFGEEEADAQLEKVVVVKGGIMDEAAVLELFKGADVILSFLGMVNPPDWVVCPGVEQMVKAMKAIVEEGGSPPKLVSMSAIGIADSKDQMKASNFIMGRLTLWLVIPYMLKECFADMEASENFIIKERELADTLNITIIRAPILKDKKGYKYDYTATEKPYSIVPPSDTSNIASIFLDRQEVAGGFLDCVENRQFDGKTVSVLRKNN